MAYDLKALRELERLLVEAGGPNYALEVEIARVTNEPREPFQNAPNYTASLDAAVALVERVLEHHEINLNLYRDRDNEWNWCATLTSPDEPEEGEDLDRWWALAPHPNAALALCLACVRALISQGEQ